MGELSIRRIANIEEWDEIVATAGERPIWLLKHSLICPLSAEGRREFERFVSDADPSKALFAMIEVQNARDVSNEIARCLGVRHETPQAILLVGDRVCWHASHWGISASALARAECESVSTSAVTSE